MYASTKITADSYKLKRNLSLYFVNQIPPSFTPNNGGEYLALFFGRFHSNGNRPTPTGAEAGGAPELYWTL
jgi:hypothetical protein